MPKTRVQKEAELKEFRERLTNIDSGALFFVNYRGLDVATMHALRRLLKRASAEITVVKKTLARLAFQGANVPANPTALEGEVGFVFGYGDPVATARALYRFSRQHDGKPFILGGWFERKIVSAAEVITLATLPSREVLLGKMVASIAAPMRRLTTVLNETMAGLVRVLHARSLTQ